MFKFFQGNKNNAIEEKEENSSVVYKEYDKSLPDDGKFKFLRTIHWEAADVKYREGRYVYYVPYKEVPPEVLKSMNELLHELEVSRVSNNFVEFLYGAFQVPNYLLDNENKKKVEEFNNQLSSILLKLKSYVSNGGYDGEGTLSRYFEFEEDGIYYNLNAHGYLRVKFGTASLYYELDEQQLDYIFKEHEDALRELSRAQEEKDLSTLKEYFNK